MKITILGSGTSNGVPLIGCRCKVCTSTDPHDHRLRSSVLIELDKSESTPPPLVASQIGKGYRMDQDSIMASPVDGLTRILIDCGPDFRQQMLRQPYGPIHAVLVTHEHYDHVGGIDDLRPFCIFNSVHVYGESKVIRHLHDRLPYCFGPGKYPSAPKLELLEISPYNPLTVCGVEVMPLRVIHGKLPILGFRIGRFAYITDMLSMPDETFNMLQGLDTLIVNALRFKPHPTHQNITQALELIARLKPSHAFLTHLAHSAGLHADSLSFLPDNVRFAYDGMQINVPL